MSCPQACAAHRAPEQMHYYRLSWMTMHDVPCIDSTSRDAVMARIQREALALGCDLVAARCVSNRVDMVLGLPPRISLAGAVRHLKNASSHGLDLWRIPEFMWDEEYDAERVPFADLPVVAARLGRP